MNWLDIVLGVILLVSLFGALRNGLSREVVRLAALVFGVLGGLWWYPQAAAYFRPYIESEDLALFAGFIAILLGSLVAGGLLAWVLARVLGWVGLRWFDRLLGGAFGLVRGLLLSAAVVLGVVAFAPVANTTETVADSRLAPWVLHGARAAAGLAPPELKRLFDERFAEVRETWVQGLSAEVSRH